MKSIRIGNDIAVTWSLYKEGQPYSLEGMAVRLYLNHALGRSEIGSFKVSGNVVAWTFEGKDQKHTGRYSLELVVNEGESGMMSVDKIDFVRLTPVTPCCEDEDEENIVTEYVDLTSSVEFAPVVIREGGAGLQYAIERTVYPTEVRIGDYTEFILLSEGERAYNVETFEKDYNGEPVFISIEGFFLYHTLASRNASTGEGYVRFNSVLDMEDNGILNGLVSTYITVCSNGDAILEYAPLNTGSSTPSDMNNDFSNDF